MVRLLVLALALVSVPLLADTGDPSPPTTSIVADDVVITASASAPAVIVDDGTLVVGTVGEIVGIITNYKASGAFIVVALILAALLKLLTKHGAFARLLEATGKTWIRPVLSVVTGAVGALASTLALGIRDPLSLVSAVVAGIGAGLGASGGVDFLRSVFFPSSRTKHSVEETALHEAGAVLEEAVVAAHVGAGAYITAVRARIAATADLAPAKRVEALAVLLKAAPK